MADADKQVAKLAHLIEGHLNHVAHQIAPEVAVEPGSMGAREQANIEIGPGGPWCDIPSHTALSLAKMKLTVAADHIGSLYKLLQPPLPLFGLMVLARTSLEASAKAHWLLDPSISVRDRGARELGDRLVSAREQRDALHLLRPGQVDSAEVTTVETEAAALGVAPKPPPRMTTLVGDVPSNHASNKGHGKDHYEDMCAFAHNANKRRWRHGSGRRRSARTRWIST